MESGKRQLRELVARVNPTSLMRWVLQTFGRWLLLFPLFAILGAAIGGWMGLVVLMIWLPVFFAPLVLFHHIITAPKFPFLGRGYFIVVIYGPVVGFFIFANSKGNPLGEQFFAEWLVMYQPIALIMTIVYGWLVRLVRLDNRIVVL